MNAERLEGRRCRRSELDPACIRQRPSQRGIPRHQPRAGGIDAHVVHRSRRTRPKGAGHQADVGHGLRRGDRIAREGAVVGGIQVDERCLGIEGPVVAGPQQRRARYRRPAQGEGKRAVGDDRGVLFAGQLASRHVDVDGVGGRAIDDGQAGGVRSQGVHVRVGQGDVPGAEVDEHRGTAAARGDVCSRGSDLATVDPESKRTRRSGVDGIVGQEDRAAGCRMHARHRAAGSQRIEEGLGKFFLAAPQGGEGAGAGDGIGNVDPRAGAVDRSRGGGQQSRRAGDRGAPGEDGASRVRPDSDVLECRVGGIPDRDMAVAADTDHAVGGVRECAGAGIGALHRQVVDVDLAAGIGQDAGTARTAAWRQQVDRDAVADIARGDDTAGGVDSHRLQAREVEHASRCQGDPAGAPYIDAVSAAAARASAIDDKGAGRGQLRLVVDRQSDGAAARESDRGGAGQRRHASRVDDDTAGAIAGAGVVDRQVLQVRDRGLRGSGIAGYQQRGSRPRCSQRDRAS